MFLRKLITKSRKKIFAKLAYLNKIIMKALLTINKGIWNI